MGLVAMAGPLTHDYSSRSLRLSTRGLNREEAARYIGVGASNAGGGGERSCRALAVLRLILKVNLLTYSIGRWMAWCQGFFPGCLIAKSRPRGRWDRPSAVPSDVWLQAR
jgi:hypothetical protein